MQRRESRTLTNWSSSGDYGKLKVSPERIAIGYQLPKQASLPKLKSTSMNFKNSPIYHELFGNRPSQPSVLTAQGNTSTTRYPPLGTAQPQGGATKSQQELSEREWTHKTLPGHNNQFNLTLRDKQTSLAERLGEHTRHPSEKSSSLTQRLRSKCPSIGENYSKIKLCTVTDRDMLLLTQAREEKTRRDVKKSARVKGHVEARVKTVKKYFKNYDGFLKEEGIDGKIEIELLVLFQALNCVCLSKTFSTLKVIETFMLLYDHHFQSLLENDSDEASAKIIDRLKDFLSRAKAGAFELEVTEDELFHRFTSLKGPKRPFLNADNFFKVKSIDAIVLTYLFLEYRMSLNLRDFKKLMSQVSIKVDSIDPALVIDTPERDAESEEDLRTAEQKLRDEAESKKQQLRDDLAKLRKEIQVSKQGIIDLGGETTYSSKYLKCIEVCLNNRDLLFDMEVDQFDKMVDLQMPLHQAPRDDLIEDANRQVFLQLIKVRDLFADQIENEGAQLKKELDLFYNPVEDIASLSQSLADSSYDDTEEKPIESPNEPSVPEREQGPTEVELTGLGVLPALESQA